MACARLRPLSTPKPNRLGRLALTAAVLIATFTPAPPPARAQDDGSVSIIRDTEIEETLRADADPIFVAAGLNPKAVKLHLVGDKDLNAFVSNGQQLFIFSGLIMETKTPNQLIGVIAHETGHMAGGHLARSGEGQKNAMKTFLLTAGLGILAAAAGAPDAGAALLYSASYFATLDYLGYSRIQEAQADQAAVTYLEAAGKSGKGLVDFFDNFRYEEVFSQAKRYPFFQSHPLTSDRIEALRVRAEKQPHYNVDRHARGHRAAQGDGGQAEGLPEPAEPDLHRLQGERHLLPRPLRPGHRLLQGHRAGEGDQGHRRPARRLSGQSLSVGAEGPGAVRSRAGPRTPKRPIASPSS